MQARKKKKQHKESSLLLIVVLSATAGYALSKFKVRGTKNIYSFFTSGIMVPVQITLIPLFIFYSDMRILNSSFSLILPQVGFALPLSVMMFLNFYDFVPNELIEASIVIKGCSRGRMISPALLTGIRKSLITSSGNCLQKRSGGPADERLRDKYTAGRLNDFSRPAAYYTEAARSTSTSSTESVT